MENNEEKKKKILVLDVSEIDPIGFNAKYYSNTQKSYHISRGKTRLFRRSLFLIITGLIISVASMKLLPDQIEGNLEWLSPLLWLPRLAAFGFIYLAVMRIKEMKKIGDIMVFDPEGVKKDNILIPWSEIDRAELHTHTIDDDLYDLVIYRGEKVDRFDIRKVDEFSEDVAVVFYKYLKKYNPQN